MEPGIDCHKAVTFSTDPVENTVVVRRFVETETQKQSVQHAMDVLEGTSVCRE